MTVEDLADGLVGDTVDRLERLVATHLPGFRVPGVFAGHAVAPDVRADLAFTLGLLHECGVHTVAGVEVVDAVARVLTPIDGEATHSFASYRVAETLARLRSIGVDANLAAACDSSSWVELLDQGLLPRNYAAVLARCELARASLGLPTEAAVAEDLLRRTVALLSANLGGHLDDSSSAIGRYDIYSADVYLFTEPFADRLGSVWRHGAEGAVDLVERVVAKNGAAVTWGRSSGALATCLTIELAGLALRHGISDSPERWLALGQLARRRMADWFADGLVAAHQYRSTYDYRGPHRRLQMTFDCLGKLVDSALALRSAADDVGDLAPAPRADVFGDRDELIVLDGARNAAVWSYRSRDLAFVLPVVGSTVTDYLPAPHNPGLFEVPVGTNLPTGVPAIFVGGRHHTAGQLPSELRKVDGGLELRHEGFARSGQFERAADEQPLAGTRVARYRVAGRTLHVDEELTFPGEVPEAVALQVAETKDRPLQVRFDGDSPAAVTVVDTAGLKEYRSFWAELPRVHQLDLDPAPELRFSWSVTPKLRVLTMAHWHHYHRSLYDPLADRVLDGQIPLSRVDDPAALAGILARWDQFHLHWPEWFLGADVPRNQRFIDRLHEAGVGIVWTQHNLVPHDRDDRLAAVYQLWAAAADGVIHHSRWGEARVRDRYAFQPGALHRVIPHGHFGNVMGDVTTADRSAAEAELDLLPGRLRLGVVGAPRPEKDVSLVMEAMAASRREDIELVVFSLGPGHVVPDDPRIVARPYEMVSRELYNRRLAAIDALVLPFRAGEMLTTGTVGDAVGAGLPSLISSWPFLAEVLGDAGICYGDTAADLTACIDELDGARLGEAAAVARALQASQDWSYVADLTFELLEAVGTTRL